MPLHHTPAHQTAPRGHNTHLSEKPNSTDVFTNKIGTQSGLICPKAVGPAAVIPGSNALTSGRARCSPLSPLTLKPTIQAFLCFPCVRHSCTAGQSQRTEKPTSLRGLKGSSKALPTFSCKRSMEQTVHQEALWY